MEKGQQYYLQRGVYFSASCAKRGAKYQLRSNFAINKYAINLISTKKRTMILDPSTADVIAQATAAFTCAMCLSVILTTIIFRSMSRKLFMQIIALISMCDLLGNTAAFFPTGGSCTFHGIWYLFFFGASFNWTVVLSFLLFGLARRGKLLLSMRSMHLIVWPLACIRGILPLSSADYVNDHLWCNIV